LVVVLAEGLYRRILSAIKEKGEQMEDGDRTSLDWTGGNGEGNRIKRKTDPPGIAYFKWKKEDQKTLASKRY